MSMERAVVNVTNLNYPVQHDFQQLPVEIQFPLQLGQDQLAATASLPNMVS